MRVSNKLDGCQKYETVTIAWPVNTKKEKLGYLSAETEGENKLWKRVCGI